MENRPHIRTVSPLMFESDDEALLGNSPNSSNKENVEEICDNLVGPSKEERIFKGLQTVLLGIPPPPAFTVPQLDCREILKLWRDHQTYRVVMSPDKGKKDFAEKIVKEAETAKWPDVLDMEHFDIYYNKSWISEEVERLSVRYKERYVGAETSSCINALFIKSPSRTASAQKRARTRRAWGHSPGRRLSHLARRRKAFSSANLCSVAGNKNPDKKMIMVEIKKMANRQKRKNSGKKTKPTPNKINKVQANTYKRALFQSPDQLPKEKASQTPNSQFIQRSKRNLFANFSSEKKINDFGKRERSAGKILSPRKRVNRSLSFHDSAQTVISQHVHLHSSVTQPSTQTTLSGTHKQKMLWAVTNALREEGMGMNHELFRPCMSVLFKTCQRLWLTKVARHGQEGSTSENMLTLAKQFSGYTIKEISSDPTSEHMVLVCTNIIRLAENSLGVGKISLNQNHNEESPNSMTNCTKESVSDAMRNEKLTGLTITQTKHQQPFRKCNNIQLEKPSDNNFAGNVEAKLTLKHRHTPSKVCTQCNNSPKNYPLHKKEETLFDLKMKECSENSELNMSKSKDSDKSRLIKPEINQLQEQISVDNIDQSKESSTVYSPCQVTRRLSCNLSAKSTIAGNKNNFVITNKQVPAKDKPKISGHGPKSSTNSQTQNLQKIDTTIKNKMRNMDIYNIEKASDNAEIISSKPSPIVSSYQSPVKDCLQHELSPYNYSSSCITKWSYIDSKDKSTRQVKLGKSNSNNEFMPETNQCHKPSPPKVSLQCKNSPKTYPSGRITRNSTEIKIKNCKNEQKISNISGSGPLDAVAAVLSSHSSVRVTRRSSSDLKTNNLNKEDHIKSEKICGVDETLPTKVKGLNRGNVIGISSKCKDPVQNYSSGPITRRTSCDFKVNNEMLVNVALTTTHSQDDKVRISFPQTQLLTNSSFSTTPIKNLQNVSPDVIPINSPVCNLDHSKLDHLLSSHNCNISDTAVRIRDNSTSSSDQQFNCTDIDSSVSQDEHETPLSVRLNMSEEETESETNKENIENQKYINEVKDKNEDNERNNSSQRLLSSVENTPMGQLVTNESKNRTLQLYRLSNSGGENIEMGTLVPIMVYAEPPKLTPHWEPTNQLDQMSESSDSPPSLIPHWEQPLSNSGTSTSLPESIMAHWQQFSNTNPSDKIMFDFEDTSYEITFPTINDEDTRASSTCAPFDYPHLIEDSKSGFNAIFRRSSSDSCN